MKTFTPNEIDNGIWKEIEFFLMRSVPLELIVLENGSEKIVDQSEKIKNFMGYHAHDGLVPQLLIADKRGLLVEGYYWILPKSEKIEIEILFKMPSFNSVQSVSKKKIQKIKIEKYQINTILKKTIIEVS